ncbi:MAG: 50S ribosome-binding GTPase [Candidatus Heimdallarchaeota archaeon]|nr:50S ribosome-binding GTPase [Candidatus Heimdallarchaeota archaeon]
MTITKLPVLGVANGGKSSLILTMKREFKTLSKKDIKPTKGIERSKFQFLDSEIIAWDFGGQEKYRESYKKKAETYFSQIEELFYVVDFQDQEAMVEAIQFYREIIMAIQKYSPNATINLLINKFDPGYEDVPEHQKLYATLIDKFQELTENLNFRAAHTTIFNPISVITAFSKPIFQNTTMYDNLALLFMGFIQDHPGSKFIMVLTKDLLEIGNYFDESVDQQKMRNVSFEIFKTFEDKKLELSEVKVDSASITFNITKFEAGSQIFYFTFGFDHNSITDSAPILMNSFNLLEDVKNFLKYF